MNEKNKKPFVLAVVGPTASGKTWLGVELAKIYGGEVISADSMQIYKGMDIASAKPTDEEKQGIPHHLMDFLDRDVSFSAADYVKLANEKIQEVLSRGRLPIIVGGTGLYVDSLLENVRFSEGGSDEAYREELYAFAKEYGNEALHARLADMDSEEFGIILRAKGIVPDKTGGWLEFDLVPGEYEVRKGNPDYTGKLCVIGSQLKEDKLAELFGL
jgi:tRNA dimethylallyltransferase